MGNNLALVRDAGHCILFAPRVCFLARLPSRGLDARIPAFSSLCFSHRSTVSSHHHRKDSSVRELPLDLPSTSRTEGQIYFAATQMSARYETSQLAMGLIHCLRITLRLEFDKKKGSADRSRRPQHFTPRDVVAACVVLFRYYSRSRRRASTSTVPLAIIRKATSAMSSATIV